MAFFTNSNIDKLELLDLLIIANGGNHGTGIAAYNGDGKISIWKGLSEPTSWPLAGNSEWAIAHIRLASIGGICESLIQPYVWQNGGRKFVLAHNGTWDDYKSLILPILQAGYELPATINDSKLLSIAYAIWGDAILTLPERAAFIYGHVGAGGGEIFARTIGSADMCARKDWSVFASEPLYGSNEEWMEFKPDSLIRIWPKPEILAGGLRPIPKKRKHYYDDEFLSYYLKIRG